MTKKHSLVALLAILLLVLEPTLPLQAQEPAAPPRSLQIVILSDEAPLNNISERTAREPIVQVQDENHKPVAGAIVLFFIHPGLEGAGGSFASGASSLTVETGADGIAHAPGLVVNQIKGSWQLQVTASKDGISTSRTINETNKLKEEQSTENNTTPTAPPPTKPSSHWYLSKPTTVIGGIVVVGVVVSIVVIEANANHSTQITTGGGTVGNPGAGFKIHF